MTKSKQLHIDIHPPFRISPAETRNWFPRLFRLEDGSILQNDTNMDDTNEALEQRHSGALRSSIDGGLTWREIATPPRFGMPALLPDGVLRSFSYSLWPGPDNTLFGLMGDLLPGCHEWTKEERFEISLPHTATIACLTQGVLTQADGSMLAALYGRWTSDRSDRSFIIVSYDDGRTWSYRNTIAGGVNSIAEGFNEPVICRTLDNDLLCVMRTGSGYPPLHCSRSHDDGFTWSKPQNLGTYSVAPDLCLMSNGVLACSFGRPWIQMTFSLDGNGETWTEPYTIVASRGNSTCYTGIVEASPGRLLLVYDENQEGVPWLAADNHINGIFIDIEIG